MGSTKRKTAVALGPAALLAQLKLFDGIIIAQPGSHVNAEYTDIYYDIE